MVKSTWCSIMCRFAALRLEKKVTLDMAILGIFLNVYGRKLIERKYMIKTRGVFFLRGWCWEFWLVSWLFGGGQWFFVCLFVVFWFWSFGVFWLKDPNCCLKCTTILKEKYVATGVTQLQIDLLTQGVVTQNMYCFSLVVYLSRQIRARENFLDGFTIQILLS